MKRELAHILEAKAQLVGESLGRTRSSAATSSENSSSSKRFKGCVVNGVIVYTRGRKLRSNALEDEKVERRKSSEKSETLSAELRPEEVLGRGEELVEIVVEEESNYSLEIPRVKVEPVSELLQPSLALENGAVEVPVLIATDIHGDKNSLQVASRRFTRSALKPKAEPPEPETAVNAAPPEAAGNELVSNLDGESNVAVNSSSTPKNKLELKMSKKIALDKKPTTVKELFDTGLVDGVPVVYMGGKKVLLITHFMFVHFGIFAFFSKT